MASLNKRRGAVQLLTILATLTGPVVAALEYESSAPHKQIESKDALLHGVLYMLHLQEPPPGTSVELAWLSVIVALAVVLLMTRWLFRGASTGRSRPDVGADPSG